MLALRALGIGPGDDVIVPANSFIATAEAVSLVGATPQLVDVDPATHLMSAELVEAAIRPRTRCVIPVHLMGSTVDMQPLMEVARAAGLYVVEDCAQAHGARYRGQRVGTFGDLGCLLVLPDQEPRRVGRRRCRDQLRTPSSPATCACSGRTARGRGTTTAWSGRRRAWTRSRPPCCA